MLFVGMQLVRSLMVKVIAKLGPTHIASDIKEKHCGVGSNRMVFSTCTSHCRNQRHRSFLMRLTDLLIFLFIIQRGRSIDRNWWSLWWRRTLGLRLWLGSTTSFRRLNQQGATRSATGSMSLCLSSSPPWWFFASAAAAAAAAAKEGRGRWRLPGGCVGMYLRVNPELISRTNGLAGDEFPVVFMSLLVVNLFMLFDLYLKNL